MLLTELNGLADMLCPVPIAPILLWFLAAKDVLVTGCTLLIDGDCCGYEPTGATAGLQVEPPLYKV